MNTNKISKMAKTGKRIRYWETLSRNFLNTKYYNIPAITNIIQYYCPDNTSSNIEVPK